ncbi:Histone H1-like protein Hc1 [Rhodonellum ikkaensis]|jgi:hypothetical protein|nr:Histone H1-like protein Hc1 [Rhodonellum ikkaensis]
MPLFCCFINILTIFNGKLNLSSTLKLIFIMSKFSEIKDLVMGLEDDFEKFYEKNNQAAGTRVRKGMQDLKNLAQEIRKEVQDKKNT